MKYLLTFLCCFLLSCGPQVRAGKIVDKFYKPEWVETNYHYMYIDDGISIPVPYTTNHPARYQIKVQTEVEGKVRDGIIEVSPAAFETLQIGEMYGLEQ